MKYLPKNKYLLKGLKKVNKTIGFIALNPDYTKPETPYIYLIKPHRVNLDLKCIIKYKSVVISDKSMFIFSERETTKYIKFDILEGFLHISSNSKDFTVSILKRTYLFGLPIILLLMDTVKTQALLDGDRCNIFVPIPDLLRIYKEKANQLL